MSSTDIEAFFDRYRAALLDRDAARIATMYAVPGLVLFPGSSVPVTSKDQTEQFFAASFSQYEGVSEIDLELRVLVETSHSTWVDLTWCYNGQRRERFCYQLINAEPPQIAVLTPLNLP